MFDLTGRKALITGAGQGMGLGVAATLASQGAHVFINDLYEERANEATRWQTDAGLKATAISGDITDAQTRSRFKEEIGTLDILVNNAGVPIDMPTSLRQADQLKEEDYEHQMNLNFHAVRALCGLFTPAMRNQGRGRILIITSESWRLGQAMGLTHYASAKAASLGFMRNLSQELGPTGITVNALSLGTMNNFDGHERAAISTAIGRAGSPEDVGAATLYLVSDEASWMTGQVIPLNGGACTA